MSSQSTTTTTTRSSLLKDEKDLLRPTLPRRSSSLHKLLITKLRPLPFQYRWSVWHSKSQSPQGHFPPPYNPQAGETYHLSLLVDHVADIGTFYRIFNNLPWSNIRHKESIHIFRAGVKPLWEDVENRGGGRWLIRVRNEDDKEEGEAEGGEKRRKDVRTWEEICLLCLGGELQSVIALERDHILGVSFSSRNNCTHISIWTKQGDNHRSILLLERAILAGLSLDLRPKGTADFNYRRHVDKVRGGGYGEGMSLIQNPPQQSQVRMLGTFLPLLPAVSSSMTSRPGPIRALTVG